MMKDDLVYLGHMLDFAKRIARKTAGVPVTEWERDEDLQTIVIHLLQNIGEAARRVSDATRDKYPEIQWADIIGMRNRIVHDYLHVRVKIVWSVAQVEIPHLVAELEAIVPPDEER
jgi:uncharacterized protein with HEPN domain